MKENSKIFTLEEANALIPEIHRQLTLLIQKKEAYARRHDELFMHELLTQAEHEAGIRPDMCGLESDIQGLESTIADLEKDIRSFREMGCLLRNINLACVDFPARISGEIIYYCWRIGESEIRFYHSNQNGVMERIPILDK